MNEIVLVTGATGFVGSHVAERLLSSGKTVRLLVRDAQRRKWLDANNFQIAVGDVTKSETLPAALHGVSCVVHCAGLTKAKSRAEYLRVNAHATREFARCAEQAGIARFVFCSSLAAAGPSASGQPLSEADMPKPISSYGVSKLEGERAVAEECRSTQWITIRPPAVMGPRDEQFLPLFSMAKRFGVYTSAGSAAREYSLIGVHDLSRALCAAVDTQSGVNEIYFATLPTAYSWRAVANEIGALAGKRLRSVYIPELAARAVGICGSAWMCMTNRPVLLNSEKVTEMLASGWSCSGEKILATWGFECEQSLRDVVRDTWNFYSSQGWL